MSYTFCTEEAKLSHPIGKKTANITKALQMKQAADSDAQGKTAQPTALLIINNPFVSLPAR